MIKICWSFHGFSNSCVLFRIHWVLGVVLTFRIHFRLHFQGICARTGFVKILIQYVHETNSCSYLLKMEPEMNPKHWESTQYMDISKKEHNKKSYNIDFIICIIKSIIIVSVFNERIPKGTIPRINFFFKKRIPIFFKGIGTWIYFCFQE